MTQVHFPIEILKNVPTVTRNDSSHYSKTGNDSSSFPYWNNTVTRKWLGLESLKLQIVDDSSLPLCLTETQVCKYSNKIWKSSNAIMIFVILMINASKWVQTCIIALVFIIWWRYAFWLLWIIWGKTGAFCMWQIKWPSMTSKFTLTLKCLGQDWRLGQLAILFPTFFCQYLFPYFAEICNYRVIKKTLDSTLEIYFWEWVYKRK